MQQLRHDGARGVLDVALRELPEQPQRRALELLPELRLLLLAQAHRLGRLGLPTLRKAHVRVRDAHGAAHLVRVKG